MAIGIMSAWYGTVRPGPCMWDDVLVAEEAHASLADSGGGLNVGCGVNREPGTFFAGLIDDVRIHNRAVEP